MHWGYMPVLPQTGPGSQFREGSSMACYRSSEGHNKWLLLWWTLYGWVARHDGRQKCRIASFRDVFLFHTDVCYTHFGPIGANNGTQGKHLVDKAFSKGRFQELLYSISRLTNEHVAKVVAQSRMVELICWLPDGPVSRSYVDSRCIMNQVGAMTTNHYTKPRIPGCALSEAWKESCTAIWWESWDGQGSRTIH